MSLEPLPWAQDCSEFCPRTTTGFFVRHAFLALSARLVLWVICAGHLTTGDMALNLSQPARWRDSQMIIFVEVITTRVWRSVSRANVLSKGAIRRWTEPGLSGAHLHCSDSASSASPDEGVEKRRSGTGTEG